MTTPDPPDPQQPDVAIKAQNPDLETAWLTIARWEQACAYWYAEAQKGYVLRDSLSSPTPEVRPDDTERLVEALAQSMHDAFIKERTLDGWRGIARAALPVLLADREKAVQQARAEVVEQVEALAAEWESWAKGRSTPRIDAFRDAAEQLRAALTEARA